MQNLVDDLTANSDLFVIERILKGGLPSFEILIRRYNPVLYKIARSYGFNHQDSEDLMQDTYVSVYMSLQKFEGRSSFKTWVSKIMVHKCLYKLKYGHLKSEVLTETITETNQCSGFITSKGIKTDDRLLNRELTVILERSLQQIPIMYRTVFVLRVIEGFSVAETATILEITTVNVKVRLNRAKNLLLTHLKQFYSNSELYSFDLIYCDAIVQKVFEQINAISDHEPEMF